MKETAKTVAAVTAAALMGAGSAWAVPVVSNVNMTQIGNTRTVQVTYDLAGENAIVTLSIETNGVAIPDSAVTRLSGDVSKVIGIGTGKSIIWNAGEDWPENVTESAKARVTAWSVDAPPQYCAVDVAGGSSATTYPVYYYTSAAAVPNGVTNDLYKTTRILMRKLPPTDAGGFKMGSPSTETYRVIASEDWHDVVLTQAFYAGVYQITQSQWEQVMGDVLPWPSHWNNIDYRLTRPVERVSYDDIRGTAAQGGAGWPANALVYSESFIGRLRSKVGLPGFDLPTDAQWEYACRAGTTGALNDGTVNLTGQVVDARLDPLGRYRHNGGWLDGANPPQDCTTSNATAAVGSYLPNAWGLYDTHGNVSEWCLDWYVASLGTAPVTDPVGAASGSTRVSRGGSQNHYAVPCRSAYRGAPIGPANRWASSGFRLVRNLP